jgi:hypothetical protein
VRPEARRPASGPGAAAMISALPTEAEEGNYSLLRGPTRVAAPCWPVWCFLLMADLAAVSMSVG